MGSSSTSSSRGALPLEQAAQATSARASGRWPNRVIEGKGTNGKGAEARVGREWLRVEKARRVNIEGGDPKFRQLHCQIRASGSLLRVRFHVVPRHGSLPLRPQIARSTGISALGGNSTASSSNQSSARAPLVIQVSMSANAPSLSRRSPTRAPIPSANSPTSAQPTSCTARARSPTGPGRWRAGGSTTNCAKAPELSSIILPIPMPCLPNAGNRSSGCMRK